MEVVVGKTAGFCPGVNFAVNKAKEILNKNDKVYCLGEIVHNKQVVEELESFGMITVQNIDEVPNNELVIFRAHGEAPNIYTKAQEKNLKVIDTTCGKVKAIHIKVQKESVNSFIIIVGKKNHPETIGTKGFAGKNSFVIESEDDILDAYMEFENTEFKRVFVVSQTTFSEDKFEKIAQLVDDNFTEAEVIVDKTICDATEIRQAETRQIAQKTHYMFVIGGKNSSNTKELVKIAMQECENVYSLETVEEIKNLKLDNNQCAGIMAGASTPEKSIKELKEYLENI